MHCARDVKGSKAHMLALNWHCMIKVGQCNDRNCIRTRGVLPVEVTEDEEASKDDNEVGDWHQDGRHGEEGTSCNTCPRLWIGCWLPLPVFVRA